MARPTLDPGQHDPRYRGALQPGLEVGGPRIIVAYRSASESLGPLRWAIRESRSTGKQLVVVHRASIAVSVHNGPRASVAHALGNATWATMFTTVQGLGAPSDAITVVESTPEHELAERYWTPGSRIVVARSLHQRRLRRRIGFPVEIIKQSSKWVAPSGISDPIAPLNYSSTQPAVGRGSVASASAPSGGLEQAEP